MRARPSILLAVALPALLLHVQFQPTVQIELGGTEVAVALSDLAVLAVLVAAAVDGKRRGFAPLAAARPLWIASGALLGWVVAASVYGAAVLPGFPVVENLVTAAKLVEYALLAPAVALLVRSRDDLRPFLIVLVGWSAIATAAAAVQFLGVDILAAWPAGRRQPSFLGHHDFAALSGATFILGLAALILEGRTRAAALIGGGAGAVLAAALAGVVGLVLALGGLIALVVRARPYPLRRVVAAVVLTAVVSLGALGIRGSDLASFLRFLGGEEETSQIETYSHRTVLAYIGLRIFLDHPVLGVGFQGSVEPEAFEPYLADAHARFPGTAQLAFPSEARPYGVQNAYIQTLADLGLVGLGLLLATFATGLALGVRRRRTAAGVIGLLWLLLVGGLWTAQGLVVGIPLAALTWITLGLIAAREQA